MAGFLDFIEKAGDFIPGGTSAIPSWLTGLLVKKPRSDLGAIAPYYQQIAEQAVGAGQFADDQAQFYGDNYRPAAVNFNTRAQSVGAGADLNEASDRSGANFDQAFATRQAAAKRSMAGVNPNSGGAMARKGAMDASYAPGKVDALNKGRRERETYGDELRAKALPFLATAPNYGPGMYGLATAGAGAVNLERFKNDLYRQEAGDTVKALKLPMDKADNDRRQASAQSGFSGVLDSIRQWSAGRGGPAFEPAAPSGRYVDYDTADYDGDPFGGV